MGIKALAAAAGAALLIIWNGASAGNDYSFVKKGEPAEVVIFTLPGCSYCRQAKSFMAAKHIPFREIELASEEGIRAAKELHIQPLAPVFFYNKRIMQGYSAERLLKFVEN